MLTHRIRGAFEKSRLFSLGYRNVRDHSLFYGQGVVKVKGELELLTQRIRGHLKT